MNRLHRLLASNRKRGTFRAEAADDSVTLYLYDVIVADEVEAEWFGGVSPLAFAKELASIKAATIHLRINSPGGSAFAAAAMQQALREHPARVVAHIDGLAASAATVVMLGASEIVMAPGALMMIHKSWVFTLGNSDELLKTAALLEKLDGQMAAGYAAKSGETVDAMVEAMAAETWYTPDEAVAIGLADRIAEDGAKAAAQWDLSAFERAPEAAPAPQDKPPVASIDVAKTLRVIDSAVSHLTV